LLSIPEIGKLFFPEKISKCESEINRHSAYNAIAIYIDGMEHSPTSATGTGWEPTPWHATQRAAWEALDRAHRP